MYTYVKACNFYKFCCMCGKKDLKLLRWSEWLVGNSFVEKKGSIPFNFFSKK